MFDNSLFEVVKFIYRDHLSAIYDMQYILYSKVHLPGAQFDSLTPVETDILIGNYRREVAAESKQQSQSSQQQLPSYGGVT